MYITYELLKEKGIEVLYLYDNVDEFAIEALREYGDKKFHSVSRGDLNLDDVESQEVKKETETIAKDNESLIKAVKENLEGKIADVKISNRLKSSAVCLVSGDNGISLAMEQVTFRCCREVSRLNQRKPQVRTKWHRTKLVH